MFKLIHWHETSVFFVIYLTRRVLLFQCLLNPYLSESFIDEINFFYVDNSRSIVGLIVFLFSKQACYSLYHLTKCISIDKFNKFLPFSL